MQASFTRVRNPRHPPINLKSSISKGLHCAPSKPNVVETLSFQTTGELSGVWLPRIQIMSGGNASPYATLVHVWEACCQYRHGFRMEAVSIGIRTSVLEQPSTLFNESDIKPLSRLEYRLVVVAARRRRNVFHS